MFESFVLIYFGLAIKRLAHYCCDQVTTNSFKPGIAFSLALDGLKVKLSLTASTIYGVTSTDVTIPIPLSTIFAILGWIYSSGEN